ncbi:hypothetical protein UFOVP264_42 [uncultured Caudovirales phage]|uniref:Uncharacterized protein n=1 Tax=uncultured Caudovirales phage TaxID=2100421 RepID=A0A6J5LI44_9CAUD|nr:hypothetical protein UFOVP264_42 [uncultured Caudovirales phage]
MAATPKPVRKLIKSNENTIKKSSIFHPKKMEHIAKETGKSMKEAHKRKNKAAEQHHLKKYK